MTAGVAEAPITSSAQQRRTPVIEQRRRVTCSPARGQSTQSKRSIARIHVTKVFVGKPARQTAIGLVIHQLRAEQDSGLALVGWSDAALAKIRAGQRIS